MKNILLLFCTLLFVSCDNSSEEVVFTQPIVIPLPENTALDSIIETKDTTEKSYPSYTCLDETWNVFLDIQEGFFLSYAIHYKSGRDITVLFDESIPVIGGVDYPEPHFINDTTYFAPNIGSSEKGHFQAYIFKNGSCNYIEVTNNMDTVAVYKK
ncbi:MAG: hypothetical protein COA97_01995 [Flavobacteriales bacterium]|nr:MAG: hypothetical protein COA97_01995 [Flavobacteriales bacterium]